MWVILPGFLCSRGYNVLPLFVMAKQVLTPGPRDAEVTRNQVKAADIVRCLQEHDVGQPAGKSALWRTLQVCSPEIRAEFTRLTSVYRRQGTHTPEECNRFAALDIASQMPSADELPGGLLGRLRGVDPLEEYGGDVDADGETNVSRLVSAVYDRWDGHPIGVAKAVIWTTAHLQTPLGRIDIENCPGPEALNMLLWARGGNETEFRRLYDSKRIPSRGLAEDSDKGLVDDGRPIEDILRSLGEGLVEVAEKKGG